MTAKAEIAETGIAGEIFPPDAPAAAGAPGFVGISAAAGVTAAGEAALKAAEHYGALARQITP